MVLFPPLHVGHPLEFPPEAVLEDLGLPQRGPGVEVVQLLVVAWVLAATGTQGGWRLG